MLVYKQRCATKCFIDGVEQSALVSRNLPQRIHLCALPCASLDLLMLKFVKGQHGALFL